MGKLYYKSNYLMTTIYSNNNWNPMVLYCVAVSHAAGNPVEMKILSEEERKSPEYKDINMTGKFPLLQTPEGCINESIAIAKYLAHGHATLLGKDEWERAKVDQWCQW